MKRREFLKVAAAGFGTLLVSGIGYSMLTQKPGSTGSGNVATGTSVGSTAAAATNNTNKKKIVVLTGSPHRNGTSALLADKFIEGVRANGHEVFRFNAAFEDIHPCRGCNACKRSGPCVIKDAIETTLMPKLLEADVIAFVTPLYYYGMSAQLMTVLNRFYAHLQDFNGKQTLLLTTAWNSSNWTFEALMQHYEALVKFSQWKDLGVVLGYGCGYRSAIEGSEYPGQALKLGQSI